MDNIKNTWKEAKSAMAPPDQTVDSLIATARQKKQSIVYFHYGNILVLTATLLVIAYFFYRVVYLKTLLSKAGMGFMLAALIIRILIEVYSSVKSKRINLTSNAAYALQKALSFYHYRRKVHSTFTYTTVGLYTLGFYFLSPEFSSYMTFKWMLLMHLSFLIGAGLLIWQIRKGIQKEMHNLISLQELKGQVNEN